MKDEEAVVLYYTQRRDDGLLPDALDGRDPYDDLADDIEAEALVNTKEPF